MSGLPTLYDVLNSARGDLSDARDWLNSDTVDHVEGRVTLQEAEQLRQAVKSIGEAKFHIDEVKRLIGTRR